MLPQQFHILFTLGVVVIMVITLVIDRFKASMVFLLAMAALLLGGVLPLGTFLAGLSNTALLTIFLLIVITAAINTHFNVRRLLDRAFGKTSTAGGFIFKMSLGVAGISAFMNNTPVVAMMMPYVHQWGKKHGVNPAKLLMPLSYAAIVGGMITLIGTSTNLVLNGLLESNGLAPLDFLDFLFPGLLVTLAGVAFLTVGAPRLLKTHEDLLARYEQNKREYLIESRLIPGGSIVGLTIEEAGLRNLNRAFVTAIIRNKKQIAPVGPNEVLQANDLILFAGETAFIMQLLGGAKGLEMNKQEQFVSGNYADLLEAVVSQNSGLDHRTVKSIGFREKYDAAIVGIHRKGEKLNAKIGSLELKTGDLLLLMVGKEFEERNQRSEDLIVINKMEHTRELPGTKKAVFWGSLLSMVVLSLFGVLSLFEGLLLLLLVQVLLGIVSIEHIKQNVSLDLLIILMASLGIGQALIDTQASVYLSDLFFAQAASWSPLAIVAGVFFATFVLTSLITNVAAISIIFPVVLSLSVQSTVPAELLFLTAAFGASCCFATPFAYQTNLMVQELGNYNFKDYLRLGLPMSILYALLFIGYSAVAYNLV
jgi:di/tricarboxylate transporter